MAINYRKATTVDVPALVEMGTLLNKFNLSHDSKENLFWEGWENDLKTETINELDSPNNLIFIAETEDKSPIGYALILKHNDHGYYEIDQLFVKEEFRSQKVGNGLMKLAIEEAKKAGVNLQLEVYTTNTRAIDFYKQLGFKESGLLLKMEFDQ